MLQHAKRPLGTLGFLHHIMPLTTNKPSLGVRSSMTTSVHHRDALNITTRQKERPQLQNDLKHRSACFQLPGLQDADV